MTAFGINILDIVFVALIAILAVRGLMHGFLEEAAALFGLALGFALADKFLNDVVSFFEGYVSNHTASLVIAYLTIFCLSMLLSVLFARLLKKVLIVSVVKWLDYMAGAVLGAVKGLVLCLLIYMGFQFIAPNSEMLHGSVMVPLLSDLLAKLTEYFPNLTPSGGVSSWFDGIKI